MKYGFWSYFRIVAGMLASMSACVAAADTRQVSTSEELKDALSSPLDGLVITLAEGDYGALTLRGVSAEPSVILRSADPARPARFSRMSLREVVGVTFENVVFDYDFQRGDKLNLRPFQVLGSQKIVIRDSLFEGDVAQGHSSTDDSFPTGFGLGVRDSNDIVLERTEIRNFYRGTVMSQSRDLIVRENNVHSIRMDGMNFAEVQNVRIEANHIHDFIRSLNSKDHADMIQFWTNRTKSPSRDIVIRNNILNSGKGWYTQSIFMRNDQVDRDLAGIEMFYQNITIENNLIINAHLHGITVGETNGLKILNNTVVRNARSAGKRKNPGLWIPQVRVAEAAKDVEISRNVLHRIVGVNAQSDWIVQDNFLVQDNMRMQPGFYGQVFGRDAVNDPTQSQAFLPKPGGPIEGRDVGINNLLN